MSLNALTTAFYSRVSASFSATRSAPWQGWERLWEEVGEDLRARVPLRANDVACGNLRFARFLMQMAEGPVEYRGFDACEPLLVEGSYARRRAEADGSRIEVVRCDIVDSLLAGEDFLATAPLSDLSVAFGFMHHLPLHEQRRDLLHRMAEHTRCGGFIVASFWRFADDERLRAKAEEVTERARMAGVVDGLSANDYVLDWQGDGEALRFCHHFTENEVDELSASLAGMAEEAARFSADGRSGELNRYAVWRRYGRAY